MRISDWSSDVCSSDLLDLFAQANAHQRVMNQSQPVAQRRADMVHELDGRSTCTALGTVDYYEVGRNAGFKHRFGNRSEEHTSELQSLMRISYAVFCLKKKKNQHNYHNQNKYTNDSLST